MSPEELLEWANRVRDTVAPEPYSVEWMQRWLEKLPVAPQQPYLVQSVPLVDCGCPIYGICMNTACPRAINITSCLNDPHARAIEDWSYPLR